MFGSFPNSVGLNEVERLLFWALGTRMLKELPWIKMNPEYYICVCVCVCVYSSVGIYIAHIHTEEA